MPVDATRLKALIEGELANVRDSRVVAHIRGMLIEPYQLLRSWDYGPPGQRYPCWMVLDDAHSRAEIGYCEYGFGPRCPWGLVSSSPKYPNMGMDSGWYSTFMDAVFESFAVVELSIWKVFKDEPDGTRVPLTAEGGWEATWERVYELRASDPAGRYDCDHDIPYASRIR